MPHMHAHMPHMHAWMHAFMRCAGRRRRKKEGRRRKKQKKEEAEEAMGDYEYEIRRRGPDPCGSVLLVVDAQEYFRAIAAPILPALQSTIAVCRRARIPVVFTAHSHKDPSDHAMLGEWWPSLLLHGTPQAQLLPEVHAFLLLALASFRASQGVCMCCAHNHPNACVCASTCMCVWVSGT
jgi:hypothetical protein